MAIENGVQNAELGYILDPAFQIENLNGKPVVGGYICIYEAGTDNKYISYENFDGAQNPFKIPLKADGRAVILGDPSLTYDVYAYDSYGNQLFSRLNVQCNVPGTINLSGADTRIKNTDGTLDISLRTLGNNVRQYTINTHNKVLDVQSPLYFVENSETATVIGFSGDDFVKEDKFEYDEHYNITGYDGSAFANTTYTAGDYVDITNNTISVTGLQPSGNYASASDVTTLTEKLDVKLDISAFDESAVKVNNFQYEGNKITAYNNSAFVGADYEAGQYVDITDDRISVTGVQPAGNYASASDVTELNNKLANKLDTSAAFTKASADTLYQPIGEYAPTGDYAYKSDLNSYQPASSMTAYATTDLVSTVSSTITGMIPTSEYELVAGSGVEFVDDPDAHTKTINVTAEGTPVTAIEQMIESATSGLQPSGDYATTAQVADKLDTTAFSTVSGDFLTAHQDISNLMPKSESANFYPMTGNPSGFLTAHQDLSDYATTAEIADKLDTTAFSTVSGDFLTAHQDLSDYATTASVADKLDTTAFSTVSGNFLTAVDLTPYQTTAGMTAYQPVGDYYSASNPSGFLTDVPAGTLNESAFEYDANDKISGYNGSAFAGGSEVPEGVMSESGLEYNAVNEISGYNGSAIAQYGAEKQWLVHDDTLVHAANSAQYALGVNLSAVAQLLGVDETVLWEGNLSSLNEEISLADSLKNFNSYKVFGYNTENKYGVVSEFTYNSAGPNWFSLTNTRIQNNNYLTIYGSYVSANTDWNKLKITYMSNKYCISGGLTHSTSYGVGITKVVGIGRKQ